MQTEHRKKKGPAPRSPECLRNIRVSVFFTNEEYAEILFRADGAHPPSFIRKLSLGKLPPQVPAINENAWAELARASANLNQLAYSFNLARQTGSDPPDLFAIQGEIAVFRTKLLGAADFQKEAQNEGDA
jgi:hypothetical protein